MLGKTTYMSMYSSMWSNRVRSGGYSGRLLVTYSSPSLSFNPLNSLIFLLDFMESYLMWCFGALQGFGSEPSERAVEGGLITSFFQEVFSSFCSFMNYSSMREVWYRFVASSPEPQANCCERAGSSG